MQKLAAELRAEASIDFLDLSLVVASVRREFAVYDHNDICYYTERMVRNLIDTGIFAGEYALDDLESGRSFQFKSVQKRECR